QTVPVLLNLLVGHGIARIPPLGKDLPEAGHDREARVGTDGPVVLVDVQDRRVDLPRHQPGHAASGGDRHVAYVVGSQAGGGQDGAAHHFVEAADLLDA